MKRLITSPAFMAIFSVIAAGLIAVYVYLYQTSQNTSSSASVVVPQVKIGGSFSLTNHLGQPVSDQDFLGKYMLVYFGYSYCPDVCPT
ncbi:MAG: SCO family protein, partial [Alphaproteobacteria bacterium]|nr:SCO family protein [Alphaproteobacteria bacterium]